MLDVDQNYGTPETPKPFPTFKECVAQDVQNVIFNSNEFAEERYIDDKLKLKAVRPSKETASCRLPMQASDKYIPLRWAIPAGCSPLP